MPLDKLKVTSFCSYLTSGDFTWRNDDWRGMNAVRLLKGEQPTRDLLITYKGQRHSFNLSNRSDFTDRIIPSLMASYIDDDNDGRFSLVPIPGSKTTSVTSPLFRTKELVQNIAAKSKLELVNSPCIVFRRELESSRRGGPRDPQVLLSEMKFVGKPKYPVIFVDDVYTTGAHFSAAVWKLEDAGYPVVGAYSFGRSTKAQPNHVFAKHVENIDCSRVIPDDDDF